jgi:LacI family transcriptional regulator
MRGRAFSRSSEVSGDAGTRTEENAAGLPVVGRGRPTMTDVARIAGVSQTSVSLVLNRMSGARISQQTRERVLAVAREIGYAPPGARRPRSATAERNVIAYIVDELSAGPHPAASLDGARDASWESGFIVAAHVTRAHPGLEATTIESILRDPMVAGVIYSTLFTRRVLLPPALRELPTVLLNCRGLDKRLHAVVPGEVAGAVVATRYLIERGHRRIGFINGERWNEASADRLKGYREALAAADLAFDPGLVRNGDWLPKRGQSLALELLRSGRPPTAIFCANDLMAMGALEAAGKMGLRVPDDLSIMGYDDQEMSRHTDPPLSTLVLPHYEMGRKAAELLIGLATRGAETRPATISVEGPLVERFSVADGPGR